MELKATRDGYGKGLLDAGKNKNVVALDADLSESTRSNKFAEKYPERFFEMGISEQDMIGTAAGLAASGKIPFASSFACFITNRPLGQVRLMAAISNLNIRIVGSHAGLLTGEDGASHQALEDVSVMRTLPNMTVIQPSDAVEAEKAALALVKHKGPAYLRLGRGKVPIIHNNNYKFEIGKGELLRNGKDVAIIATGALVHEALKAADELEKQGIKARVINMHTIKPVDKSIIIKAAKETKAIVTAEDHNIIGGLGSAVSEVLVENIPTPLERVGVKDVFGESGKPDELYKKFGLTSNNIIRATNKIIGRKKR